MWGMKFGMRLWYMELTPSSYIVVRSGLAKKDQVLANVRNVRADGWMIRATERNTASPWLAFSCQFHSFLLLDSIFSKFEPDFIYSCILIWTAHITSVFFCVTFCSNLLGAACRYWSPINEQPNERPEKCNIFQFQRVRVRSKFYGVFHARELLKLYQ
jgi:hypothetical protein